MAKKVMCEKCCKSFLNNRDLQNHLLKKKPCQKKQAAALDSHVPRRRQPTSRDSDACQLDVA